jgi:ribonuclease HII
MTNPDPTPGFHKERSLWSAGIRWLAGVDEAGRGALAGPVVAAAVVVPPNAVLRGIWSEVRDSKLLQATDRESMEPESQARATSWAVGAATAAEIDRLGIAPATRLAMARAVEGLSLNAEHLLIDWVRLSEVDLPQTCWPRADCESVSVAAASILAKVHRDRLLTKLDDTYADYGFRSHKGYGTPQHRNALALYGPCPEHRHSFAPVAQWRTLFDPAPIPDATSSED